MTRTVLSGLSAFIEVIPVHARQNVRQLLNHLVASKGNCTRKPPIVQVYNHVMSVTPSFHCREMMIVVNTHKQYNHWLEYIQAQNPNLIPSDRTTPKKTPLLPPCAKHWPTISSIQMYISDIFHAFSLYYIILAVSFTLNTIFVQCIHW